MRLIKRVKNKELVINILDKSKKTIILESETYLQSAKSHTDLDQVVHWPRVRTIEKEANELTKALATSLGFGQDDPVKDRWQTACQVVDSRPPPRSGGVG